MIVDNNRPKLRIFRGTSNNEINEGGDYIVPGKGETDCSEHYSGSECSAILTYS